VSESAARQLWPNLDALGRVLPVDPDTTHDTPSPDEPPLLSRTFHVVGIARDVARLGLAKSKDPVIYLPIAADAAQTSLTLQVHGDPERARGALVERLEAIEPSMAEVVTVRTMLQIVTYLLQIPFWLTFVLGALALVLTVSGLFSVLSYLVAQRGREIGVRMALGATRRDVGTFILAQLAGPVGLGLFVGSSLTAAFGAALLATPGAEPIGSVVRLFDPVAYAGSVLCILTACASATLVPAVRAGRIDPIAALRQE